MSPTTYSQMKNDRPDSRMTFLRSCILAVCLSLPSTSLLGQGRPNTLPAGQWCDSTWATIASTSMDTSLGHTHIPVVGCTPVRSDSAALRRAIGAVARALSLYSALTGVPYPARRYLLQQAAYDAQSLATGGRAVEGGQLLTGRLPTPQTERDRPGLTAKVLVHEVAHTWFGQYVQPQSGSGWLSEGFADFMTSQYWADRYGPQAEEEFLSFYNCGWSDAQWFCSRQPQDLRGGQNVLYAPSAWRTGPSRRTSAEAWAKPLDGDNDIYHRGALVLGMLKQYLGAARFWAATHTYLTQHAHGMADSHDFQHAVEAVTGEKMDWFFQEWVFGTRFPQITVRATYGASAQVLQLHVTQAAPVFRMPVTIRVGTPNGTLLAHALLDSAAQTITIAHVAQAPTFVVCDDSDAIVKALQFDQPTAWLIAQARREAHPWQTWWALDALGNRAVSQHDGVARQLLTDIAVRGRFALTRAIAMHALWGAPGQPVERTFIQGMRDTAVIVRRAAIGGLYTLGTSAALTTERSAFMHDSSDAVRTDALINLLASPQLDLGDRRTLFAQALAQTTYDDAMMFAAISVMAAVEHPGCDSATVGILHAALKDPQVLVILRALDPSLRAEGAACGDAFHALLLSGSK